MVKAMKYVRFLAMIATSTAAMYALTYLNTYSADHIFFSQTRAWMALIMGSAMAVIMLAFMMSMYSDARANFAILFVAALIFVASVYFVRSQRTVDDIAYMKAMIPHHSIAILTSRRAQISDPRVRKLADDIIRTQVKEIAEMKALIGEIENPSRTTAGAPSTPR